MHRIEMFSAVRCFGWAARFQCFGTSQHSCRLTHACKRIYPHPGDERQSPHPAPDSAPPLHRRPIARVSRPARQVAFSCLLMHSMATLRQNFVLAPKLTLQRLDPLPVRFGVSAGGASFFRSSQRLCGGLAPFFELLRIKAMFATPGALGCFIQARRSSARPRNEWRLSMWLTGGRGQCLCTLAFEWPTNRQLKRLSAAHKLSWCRCAALPCSLYCLRPHI